MKERGSDRGGLTSFGAPGFWVGGEALKEQELARKRTENRVRGPESGERGVKANLANSTGFPREGGRASLSACSTSVPGGQGPEGCGRWAASGPKPVFGVQLGGGGLQEGG